MDTLFKSRLSPCDQVGYHRIQHQHDDKRDLDTLCSYLSDMPCWYRFLIKHLILVDSLRIRYNIVYGLNVVLKSKGV